MRPKLPGALRFVPHSTHTGFTSCVCLLRLAMSRDLVPESSRRNSAGGDILARGRAAIAGAGWNHVLTWCSSPGQRASPKEKPRRRVLCGLSLLDGKEEGAYRGRASTRSTSWHVILVPVLFLPG